MTALRTSRRRLMALIGVVAVVLGSIAPIKEVSAAVPWNVVVLMIDDLDSGTLEMAAHPPSCPDPPCPYGSSLMPNFVSFLENEGTTFTNSFVTYSLCCPSRTTFLTGQYSHNHDVLNNQGAHGSCTAFDGSVDDSTLATWLNDQSTSYTTSMVGKYLNGLGTGSPSLPDDDCRDPGFVPDGWDDWHALVGTASDMHGYTINDNGDPFFADPEDSSDYQSTQLRQRAVDFINNVAVEPFFLYVAPSAPHLDVTTDEPHPNQCGDVSQEELDFWGPVHTVDPQPAFDGDADGLELPSLPSFNESDDGDEPDFFADIPAVDVDCTEEVWRDRLEALKSIDLMIGAIADALDDNEFTNTVVIFTSDNGYFHGEHRLHEKILPYEEGIRVPLVIRYGDSGGPNTEDAFVLNTDLAPTILALAGTCPADERCEEMDGQSLVPFLTGNPPDPADWRKRFLLEHIGDPEADLDEGPADPDEIVDPFPTFVGIRTNTYVGGRDDVADVMYVKYHIPATEREYYVDLSDTGQYETANQCDGATTCSIDSDLTEFITDLLDCGLGPNDGYPCQDLENAEDPP